MALNNTYKPAHDFGDFLHPIAAKAQVSLLIPARFSPEPSLLAYKQALRLEGVTENYFSYFSTKTCCGYSKHMFKLMDKKIIIILGYFFAI